MRIHRLAVQLQAAASQALISRTRPARHREAGLVAIGHHNLYPGLASLLRWR